MRNWFSILFICIAVNISAQMVYRTPHGSKYHLSSCRMVKNVSHQLTIKRAYASGLRPCGICKPPTNSNYSFVAQGSNKAKGVNAANRCKGITKAGARCKRKTSIGNDYCFQHLP